MVVRQSTGNVALFAVALFAMGAGACGTVLGVDFDAPHLDTESLSDGGGGAPGAGGCAPKSCTDQGFVCGTQNDGCGASIECGTCANRGSCTGGKCACQPKTCPELGATCGVIDDGCGASLECGTCGNAADACVANQCQCQPKNCAARDASCGTVPDGCGNTYSCGACDADKPNCGGGGPNKCGANACIPLTCAGHCGDMSDGCGAVLHCGGCTAPESCGGGGTANACGCTPTSCANQGKNCASIANGCGGTLDCGACTAPQTCAGGGTANVCGCTPLAACGAGKNCGTIPNGCGGNVACGAACASPQSCGGGGAANVCGCTPLTCDDFVCGSHPNGCGGTVFCGTCGSCFPSGTRITMADGSEKPIEKVVAGDWVKSPNPETGTIGISRVVERKAHESSLSRAGIVVVDGALHATRNHPIWANGKVVEMEQVREGDEIVMSDGRGSTFKKRVTSVKLEPGGVVTYDLVLDGGPLYFADGVMMRIKQAPL